MEKIILAITAITSVLITYIVSHNFKQGPVRSSAFLSLVVGCFFYLCPNLFSDYLTKNIPVIFIGASFIGMVSSNIIKSYKLLTISGIIFYFLYENTNVLFDGFGGSLGVMACISVLIIYFFTIS